MSNLVKGDTLNVNDITEEIKPFLNEYGLKAINSNRVFQLENCDAGSVRFLGTTDGVERLAELINEYAEAFRVTGILSPPISLDLVNGKKAYLCYLCFSFASARVIDKLMRLERLEGFVLEGETIDG